LTSPIFSKDDYAGIASRRRYRVNKSFEATLDRALGDRVRADGASGVDLWSALANICWHSPEGETVTYSFRQAGDLVAWVREEGSSEDWYCSGPPGVVDTWIAKAMFDRGWRYSIHS
jgi:hypothetical protein